VKSVKNKEADPQEDFSCPFIFNVFILFVFKGLGVCVPKAISLLVDGCIGGCEGYFEFFFSNKIYFKKGSVSYGTFTTHTKVDGNLKDVLSGLYVGDEFILECLF
jgi:hypothetical protein